MANKVTPKASGFSDVELTAMRERTQEMKAEARESKDRALGQADVLASIAAMADPDKTLAKMIHKIVLGSAPELMPKTWYGMPAYTKDGKVICFFQSASKFKVRYATFGFQPDAMIDDGNMWPVAFALKDITDIEEAIIVELIKKAIS